MNYSRNSSSDSGYYTNTSYTSRGSYDLDSPEKAALVCIDTSVDSHNISYQNLRGLLYVDT